MKSQTVLPLHFYVFFLHFQFVIAFKSVLQQKIKAYAFQDFFYKMQTLVRKQKENEAAENQRSNHSLVNNMQYKTA